MRPVSEAQRERASGDSADLRIAWSGLLAMACAMGIGRFAYTPVLPHLQADHALSVTAAGYIASANFIGYLLGAMLASMGWFRPRRLVWIRIGLGLSVVTTAAMAWTADVGIWAGLRLVSGVASAFVMVFGTSLLLDHLIAVGRPTWTALNFTGVGLGIATSALIVDLCARTGVDSDGIWWALAAVSLVLTCWAVAWQGHLGATPAMASASRPANSAAPPLTAPIRRRLLGLTLAYACLGFGYVITATFIILMVRQQGAGQSAETAAWMITGLAAAPSNFLWLRLAERWSYPGAIVLAYLVEAVGVVLTAVADGLAGVLLGAFMLGATFMAITALVLALGRRLAPAHSHQITGTMTVAFGLGQIAGPTVAAWLVGRSGSFLLPSLVAAAVLVLGAILTAIASRPISAPAGAG